MGGGEHGEHYDSRAVETMLRRATEVELRDRTQEILSAFDVAEALHVECTCAAAMVVATATAPAAAPRRRPSGYVATTAANLPGFGGGEYREVGPGRAPPRPDRLFVELEKNNPGLRRLDSYSSLMPPSNTAFLDRISRRR